MMAIGRLSMRVEGDYWKAYYATPDSMEDAILIGSIPMKTIMRNQDARNAFIELMQTVLSDVFEDVIGTPIEFDEPTPAPEIERVGNA